MAPVVVDPKRVHAFADADGFYDWLGRHHDREPEVWIRIYKVKSGSPSISPAQAIEAALCWGWIDGVRKGLDEVSFLQRYSPPTKTSVWSQVNVETVARLIADGRMRPAGLTQVEAARADGRWDKAYRIKGSTVPDDLQAAIDAVPEARAAFATLSAQNRFALIFRTGAMKTEAGRRKKIEQFVDMLRRGETIHPQGRPR
jgi:uncharacterized protein YdeI (YjbR/CyaY-like superfamily)